jgi:hypothetical protein
MSSPDSAPSRLETWIDAELEKGYAERPLARQSLAGALARVVRGLPSAASMDPASRAALDVVDAWAAGRACAHALSDAQHAWYLGVPAGAAPTLAGNLLRTAIYDDHDDWPSDVIDPAREELTGAGASARDVEDTILRLLTTIPPVTPTALPCPVGECLMQAD